MAHPLAKNMLCWDKNGGVSEFYQSFSLNSLGYMVLIPETFGCYLGSMLVQLFLTKITTVFDQQTGLFKPTTQTNPTQSQWLKPNPI